MSEQLTDKKTITGITADSAQQAFALCLSDCTSPMHLLVVVLLQGGNFAWHSWAFPLMLLRHDAVRDHECSWHAVS